MLSFGSSIISHAGPHHSTNWGLEANGLIICCTAKGLLTQRQRRWETRYAQQVLAGGQPSANQFIIFSGDSTSIIQCRRFKVVTLSEREGWYRKRDCCRILQRNSEVTDRAVSSLHASHPSGSRQPTGWLSMSVITDNDPERGLPAVFDICSLSRPEGDDLHHLSSLKPRPQVSTGCGWRQEQNCEHSLITHSCIGVTFFCRASQIQ